MHELDTGDARADHDEVLGDLRRRVGVPGREDAAAVDRRPVGDARAAAGRDEHGVGDELLDAVAGVDDHLVRALEAGGAGEQSHALVVEEVDDLTLQLPGDLVDATAQEVEIELRRLLGEAHPFDPAAERHRPAGGDHRLGRDAVPQVGGAADHVPLDQRDLGAEPGGVGGGGVPGWAAADDHEPGRHLREATRSSTGSGATVCGPRTGCLRVARGREDHGDRPCLPTSRPLAPRQVRRASRRSRISAEDDRWAWTRWLPVAAGVAVAAIALLQLFVPTTRGLADNGDFIRLLCHLEVEPVTGGEQPAFQYLHVQNDPASGADGVRLQLPVDDRRDALDRTAPDGSDRRGRPRPACRRRAPRGRVRPCRWRSRRRRRPGTGPGGARRRRRRPADRRQPRRLFHLGLQRADRDRRDRGDGRILAWWWRTGRVVLLGAAVAVAVVVVGAKPQYAPDRAAARVCLLLPPLRRASPDLAGGRWPRIVAAALVLLAGVITLAARPSQLSVANRWNAVFAELLPEADDPAARAPTARSPPRRPRSTPARASGAPGRAHGIPRSRCPRRRRRRSRHRRLLRRRAGADGRPARAGVAAVGDPQLDYLGKTTAAEPPGSAKACRWCPVTRRGSCPRSLVGRAGAARLGRRRRPRRPVSTRGHHRRSIGPPCCAWPSRVVQVIVVVFGEGSWEMTKHLSLATTATLLAAVLIGASIAERVPVPRPRSSRASPDG